MIQDNEFISEMKLHPAATDTEQSVFPSTAPPHVLPHPLSFSSEM